MTVGSIPRKEKVKNANGTYRNASPIWSKSSTGVHFTAKNKTADDDDETEYKLHDTQDKSSNGMTTLYVPGHLYVLVS